MSARVARETFAIERVVARIYDPRRAAIYQRLGIPTVATVSWTTDQVIRRLLPESMESDWIDASGNVALVERELPAAWAGQAARRAERAGPLHPERGHPRSATAMVVDGTLVGQEGDILHIVTRARRARRAAGAAGLGRRHRRTSLMLVAIAGAGNVGLFIANELVDSGHEVLLIENDLEVVKRIPARDGIDRRAPPTPARSTSLKEAGLDRCDVLVAATGDDEDNLVVSLLAKQEFAVPRVDRPGEPPQEPLALQRELGRRHLGEHAAPHHRAGRRGRERRSPRAPVPARGRRGRRWSRSPSPTTRPVAKQAVRDIDIPRDATIVAIVRDDHVVMPRGDTMLLPGDEVLALVTTEAEDQLRTMLTGA